jgi:CRP/FNR family transcriptional regulator, cyclic AMP receptor protein
VVPEVQSWDDSVEMPPKLSPASTAPAPLDVQAFLKSAGVSPRAVRFARGAVVFAQGAQANSVFYVQDGGVKLSVLSSAGKEAVVAMLGHGDFLGEGCLAGQPLRMGSATAVVPTAVLRIHKRDMLRMLHEHSGFSDRFIAHMLARNIRIEEDLVDQLFNSTEERLAGTNGGREWQRPSCSAGIPGSWVGGGSAGGRRFASRTVRFIREQSVAAGAVLGR